MNTATLRALAEDARKACDFAKAADLLESAIAAYPSGHENSQLRKLDIQKMTDKVKSFRAAARKLEQDRITFGTEAGRISAWGH